MYDDWESFNNLIFKEIPAAWSRIDRKSEEKKQEEVESKEKRKN
jgi:hypothetical protein